MNPLSNFSIARLPRIEFGAGVFVKTAACASQFGQRALLVTGSRSLHATPHWGALQSALTKNKMSWIATQVHGEPAPLAIDALTAQLRDERVDVVIGVGGGSVLDAAKAVAGLLRAGRSVMDYLEGVGPELPYAGPSVPFIAVPTTAGTGSEATKNAVLSVQGEAGFKKSFRHELLVAQYAIVDPDLLATCPPALIAANGMDALTQLVESYVSTNSNPLTDALAWDGIVAACAGLLPWYEHGARAAQGRVEMAYAALLSGITLAQTGLGSVHGLASPLGAFFPIPHGVVCGSLFAAATQMNIHALRARDPHHNALAKYARIGRLFTGETRADDAAACAALVRRLEAWTQQLALPRLSNYGMTRNDTARVIANCRGSSMKTNPIVLRL
ncbi:MAG: iron-containing alcohol dehydrogenase [Gammaproteobacteria bacterium]|nr:iron-containing alcohol dehydrogenase [Gammaproteobacteria bacterium]